MFNRLFPSTFGRKKLAKFAKNIAQGKNVTQIFGNRWESSNMQATVCGKLQSLGQFCLKSFKLNQ